MLKAYQVTLSKQSPFQMASQLVGKIPGKINVRSLSKKEQEIKFKCI